MVLQPNFFFTAFGTERSQQALTSKFFIICRAAPASTIWTHLKLFLGSAIWTWTYLKIFYFLIKIDFKRDIIRAKIWFPYGKRLLANNMTGQADVTLCKLGGG